jgi:hypothetical protein
MPSELLIPKQRMSTPTNIDQTPSRRNSLKRKVLNRVLTSRASSAKVNELYTKGNTTRYCNLMTHRDVRLIFCSTQGTPARSISDTPRKSTPTINISDDVVVSPPLSRSYSTVMREGVASVPAAQRPISILRLTVLPEVSDLDTAEPLSVWLAVTATVEAILRQEDVPLVPLNIVVVLDNSAYATSDSLGSACRHIMDLAGQLRHPYDHLAIVCTSPAQAWKDSRSGYVLRSLSAIDLTSLQKDLRLAIHARADLPPQRLNMQQTLADTYYLLANGEDMERTGGQYCHVVLVSSNAEACCKDLGESAPVPIHILQPAATPWRQRAYAHTGHLMLDYGHGATMKEKIIAMLDHARARTSPGRITNIRLSTESADNSCIVEEVIGHDRAGVMTIGQGMQIMIRVRIDTEDVNATPKTDALFAELEGMLGIPAVTLVKVTMTYNHSLFPDDTLHKSTVVCSLPHRFPMSIWNDRSAERGPAQQPELQVYDKLIRSISASFHPKEALQRLQQLPLPRTAGGNVSATLAAMKTELTHHVKVMSMHKISDSLPEYHQHLVSVSHDRGTAPISGERRTFSDQNHLATITESPDSGKTIIHKKSHHNSVEDDADDAARKIWKDMRRDSKSTRDLLMMRSVTVSALSSRDEHLAEIQRQALRSKRSIGTDTLRSFSLGAGGSENHGGYAPWG